MVDLLLYQFRFCLAEEADLFFTDKDSCLHKYYSCRLIELKTQLKACIKIKWEGLTGCWDNYRIDLSLEEEGYKIKINGFVKQTTQRELILMSHFCTEFLLEVLEMEMKNDFTCGPWE